MTIEHFLTQRLAMLQSIADAIPPRLYEALERKVRYEHETLLSFERRAQEAQETAAARASELPAQYFIRRRLAPHLL